MSKLLRTRFLFKNRLMPIMGLIVFSALSVVLINAQEESSILVTSLADSGDGSLRTALALAEPGMTIRFNVTGTILLESKLQIERNVTIEGPGIDDLILDGNEAVRVIEIMEDVDASISNVTITRGKSGSGAGIFNRGTAVLKSVLVVDNRADADDAGIHNRGDMTIIESSITGNRAFSFSGGIGNRGSLTLISSTVSDNFSQGGTGGIGIEEGDVTIINSTISGNRTVGTIGGILNRGKLQIVNSTIVDNTAGSNVVGSGLFNDDLLTTEQIEIVNTIISNNRGGANCSGSITSLGHNLDSDGTCVSSDTGLGDIADTDPMLGELEDNGGPTQTHALLGGSPAINKGLASQCPETDQRGVARPQGAGCDIGAYEF